MNTYLVLLRHTMDDLPLFVTRSRTEAVAFAQKTPGIPSQSVCEIFGMDGSYPISVDLVTFEDGVPVKREMIKDFDQ